MENQVQAPNQAHDLGINDNVLLSDWWNAKKLVEHYGHVFRWNVTSQKWLIWDNARWLPDNRVRIEYLAKLTIRIMYKIASDEDDTKLRKEVAKHALKSESIGKIKAMIEHAKSEPDIAVNETELDHNDWLFNCSNCTISLNTDDWHEGYPSTADHNPQNLITKLSPVCYDPLAEYPVWEKFLKVITNGDAELSGFLRRAVGYALTGSDREQCLFFLYGTGSNGKSTFMNTILELFGEYAKNTQPDTFMKRDSDTIRSDIARLRGSRLVTAQETEDGARMAESLIKQMSGGDTVTARHLYGEYFEFKPTFKVFIAGNHKPLIRGTDYGIWRRIHLIPFTVRIADKDKDKDLALKLREELPGILNWALAGLQDWIYLGLRPPQAVTSATEAYKQEMDHLGTYINERIQDEPGKATTIGDLFIDYELWTEASGEWSMSKRELNRKLEERGFKKYKSMGNWCWKDKIILTK